jgi:hypothetical protein
LELGNCIFQGVEIKQCGICAALWWPFWKWRPVEIVRCQESIRDIIIYPHMKCHWNRTMLNLCDIVVAILEMATGRNFSMSGINSGHHYLPSYQILMISDNVEYLPPIFYTVFWQPFWKWQISWKFIKCRIAPLMVTYHYLRNYWTEFHETWWCYRYMFLVGPKVFSFVVKGVKVIFWGVQRGWGLL